MGFEFVEGALPDLAHVALGELYAYKSRGLIIEKHDDDAYLMLADHGFAFEIEPSKWRIADEGKKFVEARKEAAIKADVEKMEDAPVVALEFVEAAE